METKLTITLTEDDVELLRRQAGSDDISQFIEETLRSMIQRGERLKAAYRDMAADEARERDALEWIEAAPDDTLHE